ncbi:MAG: class I SAM-dependent methyltransferase [Candidatus Heimdallarchaeota archaeon]
MNQKDNDTKQPSSLAKVYDVIAESFDSTRKYPWKEVSEFVEKVSQNDFVLDLGSGNGRHTKLLALQSRGTIGIDISYNILKLSLAKELDGIIRDLNLINSDAVKLPFKDNAFDKMISIAVIHHLETEASRKNVLSEIFRILKKDGLAQISCWGKKDIIVPWTLKNGEKISRYYYLFDIEEIETLARSVGFSIIESKESNHNLFLTIKK